MQHVKLTGAQTQSAWEPDRLLVLVILGVLQECCGGTYLVYLVPKIAWYQVFGTRYTRYFGTRPIPTAHTKYHQHK